MSFGIQSLPFDLVHSVSILLDLRSYINLGRASKHFYQLLRDENSARVCLEVCVLLCSSDILTELAQCTIQRGSP